MKPQIIILILILSFLCWVGFWFCGKSVPSYQTFSPPSPTLATPDPKNYTVEQIAITIIGFDDGTPPPPDDIRIKRVNYLLSEIISKTKETPFMVARKLDAAAKVFQEKYGKNVPRQQILEDLKKIFEANKSPMIKTTDDAILLVLAKYGN